MQPGPLGKGAQCSIAMGSERADVATYPRPDASFGSAAVALIAELRQATAVTDWPRSGPWRALRRVLGDGNLLALCQAAVADGLLQRLPDFPPLRLL